MSDARGQILGAIAAALADVPAGERPEQVEVVRDYRGADSEREEDRGKTVELFEDRLRDYGADVRRVTGAQIAAAIARICDELGLREAVVPAGLPAAWLADGLSLVADTEVTVDRLDAIDCAITGCACAIAETGTIALDGGERCGRRAITLVPDKHICVVERSQLHATVPRGLAALTPAIRDHGAPITLISGPSASSDIELERVQGVHGPRQLFVVLADVGAPSTQSR